MKESGVFAGIRPGDKVVLKPNFVQESRDRDQEWEFVITHPAIISAVIECVAPLLSGAGSITVADAPMTASSFQKILVHMPVGEWEACCKRHRVDFSILDLRDEEWIQSEDRVTIERKSLPGDPLGKTAVNLAGQASEFYLKDNKGRRLYGADYNIEETNRAHDGTNNLYSVSATVLGADVIINLPKLKCHRKAGITCCLKNMVGINTNKNWLPHHTLGTPEEGGDEFAENSRKNSTEGMLSNKAKEAAYRHKTIARLLSPMKRLAIRVFGNNRQTIRNGAWYGNDTLWRTILDLNKVMFYANTDGSMREDKPENRKRYIAIADAIWGGEGDGPMDPDRKECGCMLCGTNPLAVDAAAAKIMGFDYRKIPHIARAFDINRYRLFEGSYGEIDVAVNGEEKTGLAQSRIAPAEGERWKAPLGWRGHVEDSR